MIATGPAKPTSVKRKRHKKKGNQRSFYQTQGISRGLPVLVSETCGDASELVRHSNCGDVIDPGQTDASAKVLDRLLDDLDLRLKLSSNGRKALSETFFSESVRSSWEAAVTASQSDNPA